MRTKYQYRTRQAAEDAARECGSQRDLAQTAFNAALAGEICWLPDRYPNSEGTYYRFGIIPRLSEMICVVQFCCRGQRNHAAAYHESWLQEEINRWANTAEDIGARNYRQGLYDLRRAVNDLYAEEDQRLRAAQKAVAELVLSHGKENA